MSDIPEALGTAAEGSLLARAVEPKSGDADVGTPESACLNCGTSLTGAYCHGCGQKGRIHRTISAFMHDLLHGALHFEGKIWHTLPLLLAKPGRLTRRYIDGERAKFVSPMALFLFSVFLMFAVFQAVGFTPPTEIGPPGALNSSLEEARRQAQENIAETEAELAAMATTDPNRAALEADLADSRGASEGISQAIRASAGAMPNVTVNLTGIEAIDDGIVRKWHENPGLMLYKLQANSYKFSWLLIPLSIPFIWLLFLWRRKFKAYDHAVFVTYSLSFMTLMFVTLSVLGTIGTGGGWLLFALVIIAPLHIYKQLRGTYELSRFSAAWRLMMLMVFIGIILVLFLQILLVLGAY